MMKYGSFLIPILRSWGINRSEVVGVLIISGVADKLGKKELVKGEFQHSAGISTVMNNIYNHLTSFFNLLFADVQYLKCHQNYRSISEISIFC